jgi:hypothetical protein
LKTIETCGNPQGQGHALFLTPTLKWCPTWWPTICKSSPTVGADAQGPRCYEAVRLAANDLEGAFALAIISADYDDELIVVRQQAPLVIGFGQGEFFCASDTPAIVPYTRAVLPLENGELASLTPLGVEVYNFAGERLRKHPSPSTGTPSWWRNRGSSTSC